MHLNTMAEFIDFVEHQRRLSKKTSLAKMNYLCSLFNHPEREIRSIHVGGTNGKGSVVAFLRQVLMESGYHVATYTSPYVLCFNERISIDGNFISDEDCLTYANLIISKFSQIESDGFEQPTFFEFLTIMAFLYFRDCAYLDFAIIEVGLGGLLDSTNVIIPIVSVITTISYDHTNILGNTLAEIAANKLGIVKKNVPLISGIKAQELKEQFKNHTDNLQSPLILTSFDKIKIEQLNLQGSKFYYKESDLVEIKMLGRHQIENAALAIEVITFLNKLGLTNVSNKDLKKGLLNTRWAGRSELMHIDPVIIIDGGHNIDGVTRMCEFVNAFKKDSYVRGIFAVSADKDKEAMINIIDKTFDEVIFTKFSYKRSDDAYHLYELSAHNLKSYEESLEVIIKKVLQDKKTINIFLGSLYFVSEIRPLLEKYKNINK